MSEKTMRIICGHYGSGKTNIAVNAALSYKLSNPDKKVTLLDMDIVNPYFRASDNEKDMIKAGIRTISPLYAGSNVDIPALTSAVYSAFEDDFAVFDIGGDDSGATVLGVYNEHFIKSGYTMQMVINASRPMISSIEQLLEMKAAIEASSKLKLTGLINNTNLGDETDREVIEKGFIYAETASKALGLPLDQNTVTEQFRADFTSAEIETYKIHFIRNITKKLF